MKMFDADKTRMIGLPYGENTMIIKNYVKPFSSIPERHGRTYGRTEGRTDRQKDGQNCYINIAR